MLWALLVDERVSTTRAKAAMNIILCIIDSPSQLSSRYLRVPAFFARNLCPNEVPRKDAENRKSAQYLDAITRARCRNSGDPTTNTHLAPRAVRRVLYRFACTHTRNVRSWKAALMGRASRL